MGTIEQRFEENVQESRRFQRMEEVSSEEEKASFRHDMLKAPPCWRLSLGTE